MPQFVEFDDDKTFEIRRTTPVILADDATTTERAQLRGVFDALGFELPIETASAHPRGTVGIYVGEAARHKGIEHRKVRRRFADLREPGPQGYRLVVDSKGIVVVGSDPAGTCYGVSTLAQLAADGPSIPYLQIRDEPDCPIRGVSVDGPLDDGSIRRLAALKCNLLVVDSPDFYNLRDDREKLWSSLSETARQHQVELVPVIRTLDRAEEILKRHPQVAEGRIAVEKILLERDDWALLPHRNIVDTKACPLVVRIDARFCKENEDYVVDPGTIAYPFKKANSPWLIRRVPGGIIPDGASVEVLYTYVPPGTTACCPNAPEARAFVGKMVRNVTRLLEPRFMHIGMDEIGRLNQDARCAVKEQEDAETLAQWMQFLHEATKESDEDVRLIVAQNPLSAAAFRRLKDMDDDREDDGPTLSQLLVFHTGSDVQPEKILDRLEAHSLPVVATPPTSLPGVYRWCNVLARTGERTAGLIVQASSKLDADPVVRLAMEKAWSVKKPMDAWAQGLNAYFGTEFWQPSYEAMLDAAVAHLNRRTLLGTKPGQEHREFQAALRDVREGLPLGDLQTGIAEQLYRNLTRYVELEADFSRDMGSTPLGRLVKLVENQATADVDFDPERKERIIDIVKEKRLFVPSSILFGVYLLPYRPLDIPKGYSVLEVRGAPEFHDSEHQAQATYDFLDAPGPVCRVDFETVGTASLRLEHSRDGEAFTLAQEWASKERGGVRAPVLPERPFRARFLRITADAPAETAVLRNIHVFAFKEPSAAICPSVSSAPELDASFKDSVWAEQPQVDGFVCHRPPAFATAQTTVRLCRTKEALYLGVYAREPRMESMMTKMIDADSPLWKEECVEFLLQRNGGPSCRLVVNPLGTRFDSKGGDTAWDAEWDAQARQYATGWAAELSVPFSVLGGNPKKGEVWSFNVVRHRRNVKDERSSWAYREEAQEEALGRLIFN